MAPLTPKQKADLALQNKSSNTGDNKKRVNTSSSKKQVDAYGPFREFMDNANYYGNPLETKLIDTFQDTRSGGGFGRLDYEHFKGNNKDLVEQFEKEFKRPISRSEADAKWFQSAFNTQLEDDAKKAGYSPTEIEGFKKGLGFVPYSTVRKGKNQNAINELDSKFGDWTNSRARFKFKPKQKGQPPVIPPNENLTSGQIVPNKLRTKRYPNTPEWWLQDQVQLGQDARNLFSVKKYMPWQATPDVFLPTPTFYDPTRELASNAELANIGTQGASTFAGPQSFAANFSKIQGNAANNAANILSKYNNMNVGVANQFESQKAQIMNSNAMVRANSATQLFDKNTIANQQFDNSKRAFKNQLTATYKGAITNKTMADTLNQLNDNYAVSPSTGGLINFVKDRELTGQNPDKTFDENFASYMNAYPGTDPRYGIKYAEAKMGIKSKDDYPDFEEMAQMYGQINTPTKSPMGYPFT